MAKTKPIGVRFDEDGLKLVQKERELDTPQRVLNWFFQNYHRLPKEFKKEEQPKLPLPKPEGKWDFTKVDSFFRIEDFTEYPAKDCPPAGFQRSQYIEKKGKADAEIRAAWKEFQKSKQ